MTELATRYGIGRKTVYKWVTQLPSRNPPHGLTERAHAPHERGRATPRPIREAVSGPAAGTGRYGLEKAGGDVAGARAASLVAGAGARSSDLFRREGLSQSHTAGAATWCP